MSYPPNQHQGYYPPQGGYYDPNQPQYATQGHPTTTPHGHGPPPPVPGNRPPIPGNRPAAPTPFNHGQAPAIPTPQHSAPAPAPGSIPVPHHGSGSHSTAMPTAAPNAHSANPHQTAASSHPVPGGTVPYNGLIVPDLRAPPAAHGVPKVPGYNPLPDAEAIHKACKGFGTDEAALIKTLTKLSILQMDALSDFYVSKYGRRLVDHLDKEASGYFGLGIHALVSGPLVWDVELLNDALSSTVVDQELLFEILVDRSANDLWRLTIEYKFKYGEDLSVKIRDKIIGKNEQMFLITLNSQRPPDTTPLDYAKVDYDILALYQAGQAKVGTDEKVFFEILLTRSRPHLTAVVSGYGAKYRSLSKVIKSEFSGSMRDCLLFAVEGVKPKRDRQGIWRDAKLIDKAMVGFGTKDKKLVYRIVRAHWDPKRLNAVKGAYQSRTGKTLEDRVKKETSGDYEKLMMTLLKGQTPVAVAGKVQAHGHGH